MTTEELLKHGDVLLVSYEEYFREREEEQKQQAATVQQAKSLAVSGLDIVGRYTLPSRREVLKKLNVKRKDYLVGKMTAEADRLSDQARFIMEKCNNTLVVENKKRKVMIDELIKRGYRADPVKEWTKKVAQGKEEVSCMVFRFHCR